MTKSNSPLCMKRFNFDWFSSADLRVLKQFFAHKPQILNKLSRNGRRIPKKNSQTVFLVLQGEKFL